MDTKSIVIGLLGFGTLVLAYMNGDKSILAVSVLIVFPLTLGALVFSDMACR
jgi:hypothetical protein